MSGDGGGVLLLSGHYLNPVLRGCHPDHVRNDLVTMSGNPLDLLETGHWWEVEGHVVQDGFAKPIGIFMRCKYQVTSYNREGITRQGETIP